MDPIYSQLPPEDALEVQRLARLIYESREHRRTVLDAVGASDEDALLARIRRGDLAEHPAYEHYLAARILADTHEAARELMSAKIEEINRR